MKKIILMIGIVMILLISGCDTTNCVNNSAEAILLVYEYNQEHTIIKCFEYCKDICFKTIYVKDGWTDDYCAELCLPND